MKTNTTRLIAALTFCAAACFAQSTASTDAPPAKKKTVKTAKVTTAPKPAPAPVAQPLTIPKDATQNPDGTYAYTDKAGKKWTYSRTPFGVSKIQDMSGAKMGSAFVTTPKEQLIHATDNGDTVKFDRQTPFGTTHWEKKKSELNDEERSIYESQTAQPAASVTKPE